MTESTFWDKQGNPIDAVEWGQLFEDFSSRLVNKSVVAGTEIVTVWLGHDGQDGPMPTDRPTRIFGTLVGDEDEFYSDTLIEARQTHHRITQKLLAGLTP